MALLMPLIGGGYLLWMAWRLLLDSAGIGDTQHHGGPGFCSGAMVQGMSPNAWLAAFASLSTFFPALENPRPGMVVFAALFGAICQITLMLWAWAGARIPPRGIGIFNRIMAMLLALSVACMPGDALA